MTKSDTEWLELDTSKSDHGAAFGKYHAGCTLLEITPNTVAVVGVCSCSTREDAMRVAENNRGTKDKDRFITRAKLISWAR